MRKISAIITGGSRGIGFAIANELATANANLFIIGRNSQSLNKAKTALIDAGAGAVIVASIDMADKNAASALKNALEEANFTPNVVVACAGAFHEESLLDSTTAHIDEQIKVNLTATVELIKLTVPMMQKQEYKRIIIIGSTAGYEYYAYGPIYSILKWSLRGLTANLREELKKDKIGVTLVSPGGTLTDLWQGADLPPNRLMIPSDVAKMTVASLHLSDQAVMEEIIMRPIEGDMHS